MTKSIFAPRSFRPFAVFTCLAAVVISGWAMVPDSSSQATATSTSNAALTTMITKINDQQTQMAANQTKIEAQMAQLEEALRQAKIYSARSGSGHR